MALMPRRETETREDQHQRERRQAWLEAWTCTASANDCKSPQTATNYADSCLEAFDQRFRNTY